MKTTSCNLGLLLENIGIETLVLIYSYFIHKEIFHFPCTYGGKQGSSLELLARKAAEN